MGLMDRVKKTEMSIMYDYLDKDPDPESAENYGLGRSVCGKRCLCCCPEAGPEGDRGSGQQLVSSD